MYCLLSDRLLWRKERILASCPFRGFQRSIKTIPIFAGKYSTFIYNPQALLESEKIPTLPVSLTEYTEREEIQAWH